MEQAQRRRFTRRSLVVLVFLLAAPAAALAQTGSIAGEVTDETGGVLPGVTVEATSPALIEGVRATVTDGAGPVRDRGAAPRHVHRYVHVARVQHVRPGGHRADVRVHGERRRADERRRHRRDRHGVGRQPHHRRAERRHPGEPVARAARRAADGEDLLGLRVAHGRHDQQHRRRRPGRRRQHGRRVGPRRDPRQLRAGRRRRLGRHELQQQHHRRRRVLQAVLHEPGGHPGDRRLDEQHGRRDPVRRRRDQRDPEGRREPVQLLRQRERDQRRPDGRQRRPGHGRTGRQPPGEEQEDLGLRRRRRGTPRARPRLVLHRAPLVGGAELSGGDELQPDAAHAVLHARPGAADLDRLLQPGQQPAAHGAGDRAAQVHGVAGLPDELRLSLLDAVRASRMPMPRSTTRISRST